MTPIAPLETPIALPLPDANQSAPSVSEAEGTNWEAEIITPSKPVHSLRVKLKYEGRRKPMPAESPWAE